MKPTLPQIIFAIGMMGLGVLTIFYGDFALNWQPVPDWWPARRALIYISGCALLGGGAALLWPRNAVRGAMFMGVYLAMFWVLPQVLKAVPKPASIGLWLGFFETVGVMCGAGLIWAAPRRNDAAWQLFFRLFGACCVFYGLSHFAYADFTATMVPAWLPQRLWLAYATGAVHIAAGLALLLAWQTRAAAWLEGLMMSSFVLLVHLPSLWSRPPPAWGPTLRTELTPLFWASALAATALLIAWRRVVDFRTGVGSRT